MKNWKETENKNVFKKHNYRLHTVLRIVLVLLLISLLSFTSYKIIKKYTYGKISVKTIRNAWDIYDYQEVYNLSKEFLESKPFNSTVLAYYSYACFFLAQAQEDTQSSQSLLDESIINLRIALYSSSKSLTPQLQYMLGRAYYYKNTISTHYYADLAVKYLLAAQNNGYVSEDISEYLGLSYAALGMHLESISAFSEALLYRESDTLLLSIAEQYYKSEKYLSAKQYLYRVINSSINDEIIEKCRIILASIYIDEAMYNDALYELDNVLKKNINSADAHYKIGVIYEKQGNIVKARSQWRKATKIQANHAGALQKLSEN